MSTITTNSVVGIHYTLRDDNDEIIDSSVGSEPLVYLHGFNNIIPGLEETLEGKNPGDEFSVTISPDKAYGEYDPEQTQVVAKSLFENMEPEVGMQFHAHTNHGPQVVTVKAIDADEVTIDANHPMAGQTLHFEVEVLSLREATKTEIEHGHVHADNDSCSDEPNSASQ